MNIVELLEKLSVDRTKIEYFSAEEIIRIEKQLNVEKRINPEIDVNTASLFIEALKNYPKEFQFVTNNRILYNFFAKTNLSRNNFSQSIIDISQQQVQSFVARFLDEDLKLFFDKKMSENNFEEMSDLLEEKVFFPEDLLFNLGKKSIVKIDFALARMNQVINSARDIDYIKRRSFYNFLGHLRSIEMDEKIKSILNRAVDIYNRNNHNSFARETLISLSYYEPFEEDFKETLVSNRFIVEGNSNRSSSSSSSDWFGGRTILVIVLIFIKLALGINRCSSDSSNYESNVDFEQLYKDQQASRDLYYERMKNNMDSMFTYLVKFDKNKLVNLHYNDTIKTGDNPYKYLFNNASYGKENSGIRIHNDSDYDIVVFEKVVLVDSIKGPQQATFIKSKQTFELLTTGSISNRYFSFYAGKKLATFHEEGELAIVRENSTEEPRFVELPSNVRELLSKDYLLEDDVYIKSSNGKITITLKSETGNSKYNKVEVIQEEPSRQ